MTKLFRVYFRDGNQKLYRAPHIRAVINRLNENFASSYGILDVVKIEEVLK